MYLRLLKNHKKLLYGELLASSSSHVGKTLATRDYHILRAKHFYITFQERIHSFSRELNGRVSRTNDEDAYTIYLFVFISTKAMR